jgi:hypothetical protein
MGQSRRGIDRNLERLPRSLALDQIVLYERDRFGITEIPGEPEFLLYALRDAVVRGFENEFRIAGLQVSNAPATAARRKVRTITASPYS